MFNIRVLQHRGFYSLLFVTVIFLASCTLNIHRFVTVLEVTGSRTQEDYPINSPGFIIHTPSCKIRDVDPFDASIKKFLHMPPKFICSKKPPLLLVEKGPQVKVNKKAFPSYQVKNIRQLYCCYQVITRQEQNLTHYNNHADNRYETGRKCVKIDDRDGAKVERIEFILATCKYKGRRIYKNVFAFVPDKTTARKKGFTNQEEDSSPLSVLLVGIDSMSRLNLARTMNKTANFLRRRGALELYGFVKVADNTFPNLIVELTGYNQTELSHLCWPGPNTSMDGCPFVWQNFSRKGYVTAYAEDAPVVGTFNYKKTGFVHPPTDYYPRPFNLASEKELDTLTKEKFKVCVGDRLSVDVVLRYAQDFVHRFHQTPYLALFWTNSLTHTTVNTAPLADQPYLRFFTNVFEDQKTLNRTILVFFSDHGMRFGDIRETYVGWLEERMPFFMIWVPPWFRAKHPRVMESLETNSKRLTSPFDVYCTLMTVLRNRFDEPAGPCSSGRGHSLFQEVPLDRTCSEAGIAPHWCTCHEAQEMAPDSPEVLHLALFLVRRLNEYLRPHGQCAQLRLDKVISARVVHLGKETKKRSEYVVGLRTQPGKAIFEGTIQMTGLNPIPELLGPLSRLNLYAGQSDCVSDYELKKYCYCNYNVAL